MRTPEWYYPKSNYIFSFLAWKKMHFLAYAATIEQVEPALFPMLADWRREYTMEDVLVQLKKEMSSTQNRKLVQPPDGDFSFDSF